MQVDPPPHVLEDEIGLELAGPDLAPAADFDARRPAVVASAGVSIYLTREANVAALAQVAELAPGSTFAKTFLLPTELTAPELRPGLQRAAEGARATGTPFPSFFAPDDMLQLAERAGFRNAGTFRPVTSLPATSTGAPTASTR